MTPKTVVLGQEMSEEEKRQFERWLERDERDSQLDAMARDWQREHPEENA
jgi:hypothetical protein